MSFDDGQHWNNGTYYFEPVNTGTNQWQPDQAGWQSEMGWQYDAPWQPLGVSWQFPSDHLPVATALEDGTLCASWNVLDTRFVKLVEGQGLNGSMITQQNCPVGADDLTLRDVSALNTVLALTATVSVLALQECSQPFLAALSAKLAGGPFLRADNSRFGDAVLLYNSDTLELHQSEMHAGHPRRGGGGSPFSSKGNHGGKPVVVAEFGVKGAAGTFDTCIRVVACKIAGDPSAKHLREYASFLRQCICPRAFMPTVLLGDFNFQENEIQEALWAQGVQHSFGWGTAVSRYPTNIQPYGDNLPYGFGGGPLAPKRIDHVVTVGCGHQLLTADDLLPGLGEQVQTLCGGSSQSDSSTVVPVWKCFKDLVQARTFLEVSAVAAEESDEEKPPVSRELIDASLVLEKTPSQRVMVAATAELRRLGLPGSVSRKKARRVLEMPEVAAAKDPPAAAVAVLLSELWWCLKNATCNFVSIYKAAPCSLCCSLKWHR